MICDGYYNSLQAMRLNAREEKVKEGKLRELRVQEDKKLENWAKKQFRIEQQIATKQSPQQLRARRILNKRKEDLEIRRIHNNNINGVAGHEEILSQRPNNCFSERKLKASLEKTDYEDILRTNSTSSLPIILPAKKQSTLTQSRSTSLPLLFCNPTTPLCKNKRPSLPPIDLSVKECHKIMPTPSHLKLPPLKTNC